MTHDLVAVPVDPGILARALDRHPDFRVLRRIGVMDLRPTRDVRGEGLVGVALDVETTSLNHDEGDVIELAMQRFRVDDFGRIVETGRPRSWLEQPSAPIPPEITRVTGLADPDVEGRSIGDGEATAMLLGSDFVVAHNAAFDRPWVERRLPLARGRPWACSLADVDWRGLGFEGRTLSSLLTGMGFFYDPHRAQSDVNALLHLLASPLDDGGTVAKVMIEHARRPTWEVSAVDAPFSARQVLKSRGYSWNARRKLWTVSVDEDAVEDEVAWAALMLYAGRRDPEIRRVTWEQRYGRFPDV